jgi:hypothetical protein
VKGRNYLRVALGLIAWLVISILTAHVGGPAVHP